MTYRDILKQHDTHFGFYEGISTPKELLLPSNTPPTNTHRANTSSAGIVTTHLDTSSPDILKEFMAIMRAFGTPQPEKDPGLLHNTQQDNYVLTLKMENIVNASHAKQPFSRDELSIHVEKSFAALQDMPNFLGLLCLEYENPAYNLGGDTLVIEQAPLLQSLTDDEKKVLRTSYIQLTNSGITARNPILCTDPRVGEFLCFRDAGEFRVDWNVVSIPEGNTDTPAEEISIPTPLADDDNRYVSIFEKIYAYLYNPHNIQRVQRTPGLLVIIDNKKYFHGKTEVHTYYNRTLQRIRVV